MLVVVVMIVVDIIVIHVSSRTITSNAIWRITYLLVTLGTLAGVLLSNFETIW